MDNICWNCLHDIESSGAHNGLCEKCNGIINA